MIIKSLRLSHFRNITGAEINFNDRLNIIVGPNGQGKTNIIESIYLLTEGSSFRYAKNENLISLGHEAAFISASAENQNLDYSLRLKINKAKKEIFLNEKPAPQSKLAKFSAVLFSPESLNVIKESSEERRNLVDQIVEQTQKTGLNIIYDFKKILRTRNRLLKDLSEEKISFQMGYDTLQSLNLNYLKLSVALTHLRILTLREIKPDVDTAIKNIHGTEQPELNFKYMFSDTDHTDSDTEKIAFFMKKRMQELESAEIKSGVSLVGPQKHDISFLYNGNDSRFYCSQGQQRSIILAYKMAQIVYHQRVHGIYPLLLLDDVLSELDLNKQESLISTLNQTETQTFVTTTDVTLLPKLSMNKASVFSVRNGQIVEQ